MSALAAAPPAAEPTPQEHDRRIERLLAEAQAAAGPAAWPRVEALVTALVDLYGSGIARILACARASADPGGGLDERLAADDLVRSLLLLHDLHPVALEERIERALARVKRETPNAAALTVLGIEEGVLHLRAAAPGDGQRLPSTALVARAVEMEAPELAGVQIDGAVEAAPVKGLVPAARLVRGAPR